MSKVLNATAADAKSANPTAAVETSAAIVSVMYSLLFAITCVFTAILSKINSNPTAAGRANQAVFAALLCRFSLLRHWRRKDHPRLLRPRY